MDVIREWKDGPTRREMVLRMNRFLNRYADACPDETKAEHVRQLTVPLFAV